MDGFGHLIMLALSQDHGLLSVVPHLIEVDTIHDQTHQYLGEDILRMHNTLKGDE